MTFGIGVCGKYGEGEEEEYGDRVHECEELRSAETRRISGRLTGLLKSIEVRVRGNRWSLSAWRGTNGKPAE